MKRISLTKEQFTLVDDWNYDYLNQWKWYALWNEHTNSFYAVRSDPDNHKKVILMHRQIISTPTELICDHKNHDTLDNQEENLRNVTYSQNSMNSKLRSDNSLGERCISPYRSGFRVQVRVKGKTYGHNHLDIVSARIERDTLLEMYHGDFSYFA